jgi:hypothetical protein
MALDFQEVRRQVVAMGKQAPRRAQLLQDKRQAAQAVLAEYAADLPALQIKVEAALSVNPNLRCAIPTTENLNFRGPTPSHPKKVTILAVDGSQINPDRHAVVDYCLVNVGAIQLQHGSSAPPQIKTVTELLFGDEMYAANVRVDERMVALMRDLRERTLLADLVQDARLPIITLTDGPLELWVGQEDLKDKRYKDGFTDYLEALRVLHKSGASTAGYIDRPRGDLLVRLLEIAILPLNEIEKAGRDHRPFFEVTDANIFWHLLQPGERSAIFEIQTRNSDKYTAELALHFFYLNVGRTVDAPYPVRVEIPAWVARNPAMIDDLQAVLVHQCQILSTNTFPYLLHRSHEVAVVTQDEKKQVENMIVHELRSRNIAVGGLSQKQNTKALRGKRRFSIGHRR